MSDSLFSRHNCMFCYLLLWRNSRLYRRIHFLTVPGSQCLQYLSFAYITSRKMSQKTILSFFKQNPVPSSAAPKSADKQGTPKKVKTEECYDDSPIKQQKKRKRIKHISDSDEGESSSADEAQTKKSNSSTNGKEKETENSKGSPINGGTESKPKAKKAKIKNSPNSSISAKPQTNGSSKGKGRSKKLTQLHSDEEENAQSETNEMVKDDQLIKTDKTTPPKSIVSEDNAAANNNEVVTQNNSVDFIPKRKTARKQMRGNQGLEVNILKKVENSTSLETKSESTVVTKSDECILDNDESTKLDVSTPQDEKMEVDESKSDQEITGECSKNIEDSKDNDSHSKKEVKRGANKITPESKKKGKNIKSNKKANIPKTDKNLENSNISVTEEAENSEKDDSDKSKTPNNSNDLSSSNDEITNVESSKAEDEVSTKKTTIHPFFASKKNESDSPKKEGPTKKLNIQSSTSSGTGYNPSKSHYHPIDDACWKYNEKVPYLALAKTLEFIENTSARLQMIEILSNFLRSVIVLMPEDLLYCVYLCLNRLAPEYEGIELGIGDMLLMKAVAQATGRTVDKIKAEVIVKGDLGLVAESSRGNQRVMFAPPKLTVSSVFAKFKEIAKMSGNTVMSKKTDKIQALFVACRDCEAKYIIRSLSGKLRIGLAEQSVLAALARAAVMTPPNQSYPPEVIDKSSKMSADNFKKYFNAQALILKTTYCECPNFDLVIPVLLKEGIEGLPEHCQLSPGCPLKPMLAHPTNGIEEVLKRFDKNEFTCEYKYDGERAQIHMNDKGEVKIFSRNQEDNTSKYPDIISRISKALKDSTKTFILDTEAVAWDCETKQILPFQVLSTRKKKDAVESDIVVQVCIMAFDLLYLNGESLVKKTLKERRELLHSSFVEIPNEIMFVNYRDGDSAETMQEFLDESIKGNCEGLMVKALTVDASYEIAKRSHNWLKLKKDYLNGVGDTLDLVVIGGYHGKGKRTGTYGGFLLACYDDENEEFQSICKLGTGFSEEELSQHTKFLKEHVIKAPKSYYCYDSSIEPDEWFEAVQIWEIKCADLSISPVHKAALGRVEPEKGISLRFPRFLRIRDDKTKPEDCTDASQIVVMYESQEQVQNTKNKTVKPDEDYY